MARYSLGFVASACFPKQGNFRDRVFCTLAKESMLNAELVKEKKDASAWLFCASLRWGAVQGGGETDRENEDNINAFLLAKTGGKPVFGQKV